jgi:ring-1,2-phenylacetyl-CoA epoxidase subunit PaaA
VPQIEFLGLELPDAGIKWNEARGSYDYSDPDWSEFFDVIQGNGPCNVDRLAARNKAWKDGAWVRDGLLAQARKKSARKHAAE